MVVYMCLSPCRRYLMWSMRCFSFSTLFSAALPQKPGILMKGRDNEQLTTSPESAWKQNS